MVRQKTKTPLSACKNCLQGGNNLVSLAVMSCEKVVTHCVSASNTSSDGSVNSSASPTAHLIPRSIPMYSKRLIIQQSCSLDPELSSSRMALFPFLEPRWMCGSSATDPAMSKGMMHLNAEIMGVIAPCPWPRAKGILWQI